MDHHRLQHVFVQHEAGVKLTEALNKNVLAEIFINVLKRQIHRASRILVPRVFRANCTADHKSERESFSATQTNVLK